jgi:hypothetical protein
VHSAEGVAASSDMSTAKAGVSPAEPAAVPATTVSAAALRPQRHSQQKRERRNGHKATHTPLL